MLSHVTVPCVSKIRLMVCDMAGTTVREGGVVYASLQGALNHHGMDVTDREMNKWHGVKKESVIEGVMKERDVNDDQLFARI